MIHNEGRPPYIRFAYEPVEDRNESIKQGHYVSKDVPFVTIAQPGSTDTVVRVAEEWLRDQAELARQNRVPMPWYNAYVAAYEAWKKGEEIPLEGTPIKTWPVLSPSAAAAIIQAGFRTIEDLANAPDNGIGSIGTGALMYKQKAKAWLEAASGPGKLAERLNSLEVLVGDLQRQNKALLEENARLKPAAVKEK